MHETCWYERGETLETNGLYDATICSHDPNHTGGRILVLEEVMIRILGCILGSDTVMSIVRM